MGGGTLRQLPTCGEHVTPCYENRSVRECFKAGFEIIKGQRLSVLAGRSMYYRGWDIGTAQQMLVFPVYFFSERISVFHTIKKSLFSPTREKPMANGLRNVFH